MQQLSNRIHLLLFNEAVLHKEYTHKFNIKLPHHHERKIHYAFKDFAIFEHYQEVLFLHYVMRSKSQVKYLLIFHMFLNSLR